MNRFEFYASKILCSSDLLLLGFSFFFFSFLFFSFPRPILEQDTVPSAFGGFWVNVFGRLILCLFNFEDSCGL